MSQEFNLAYEIGAKGGLSDGDLPGADHIQHVAASAVCRALRTSKGEYISLAITGHNHRPTAIVWADGTRDPLDIEDEYGGEINAQVRGAYLASPLAEALQAAIRAAWELDGLIGAIDDLYRS